jgi:hypothetical protein
MKNRSKTDIIGHILESVNSAAAVDDDGYITSKVE